MCLYSVIRYIPQWSVTALLDNRVGSNYFYKLSVYTGLRSNAGTSSNICFLLTGEHAGSGVRVLDDNKKKVS